VWCCVLQRVAVCCNAHVLLANLHTLQLYVGSVLVYFESIVAECYCVLQFDMHRAAACCIVLQHVAVCGSVWPILIF